MKNLKSKNSFKTKKIKGLYTLNFGKKNTMSKTNQFMKKVIKKLSTENKLLEELFIYQLNEWLATDTSITNNKNQKAYNKIIDALQKKSKNLKLNKLQLNSIPPLYGLTHLESLNLSDNKIQTINTLAFTGLEKLKKLNISNNEITNINKHSFKDLNQ